MRILFDVPTEADAARLATVLRDASVTSRRPHDRELLGRLAEEIDEGLDAMADLFGEA